ncbi:MAG TPA: ABC transporter permease, partial [Bacteroidota bacterium]|nr:ABC transporter permease [Bacteroidota bacterium]
MPSNILPIARKEFRQLRRDKRALGVLLVIPSIMLVMFGYALNFDVKHSALAVCDQDNSRTSRDFARLFFTSEYFDDAGNLGDVRSADKLLDEGKISAVIVIPPDFSRNVEAGRDVSVQVIVDGTNSNAATTIVGYMSAIIQQYSLNVMATTFSRRGGVQLVRPIDLRPRIWYNPELRSAKFLVPGLIAFILTIAAVVSTSLAVVREWETGTVEQIIVSPVKPAELILGKCLPYIAVALIATVTILLAGYVLFDVQVRGSYILLFVVTLVFLIGSLGLGLLISSVAGTQQVAFMVAVLATMLPTFILSGFVFPIRNMPAIIQAVTYLIPARYFLVALRSIILKGAGLSAFWDQLLYLLAFSVLTLGASSARMKKLLR